MTYEPLALKTRFYFRFWPISDTTIPGEHKPDTSGYFTGMADLLFDRADINHDVSTRAPVDCEVQQDQATLPRSPRKSKRARTRDGSGPP